MAIILERVKNDYFNKQTGQCHVVYDIVMYDENGKEQVLHKSLYSSSSDYLVTSVDKFKENFVLIGNN